jgi:hypothetical protein
VRCDEWGIDVADAVLRFDRTAGRWEYSTGDLTTWVTTENPTSLLRIARSSTGRVVGFTFDADVSDPSFSESLGVIRKEFGDEVSRRVSSEPGDDVELLISTSSTLTEAVDDGVDVMRQDARLQRASSDVVITDDSSAGIVTVTMTVPWWARFTKPWVAVRRRGKRDILLTGPMHIRGRTAKATLRYGMPYSSSALTADVVKGPQRRRWIAWVATLFTLLVVVVGAVLQLGASGDDLTLPSEMQWDTPGPEWIFERVNLPNGAQCLTGGMRFQIEGNGFRPETGLPGVYMSVWDDFSAPIPRAQLVPVAARVDSATRMTAEVPAAQRFPTAPKPAEPVTIVLVSDPSQPSAYGNTVVNWCK